MPNHNIFSPESYFDLSNVSFAEIFQSEYVWDALKRLDDYLSAQFETGKIKSNYGDTNNIFIGEGTTIEEGALIKGPAIIGKNCTIRHNAYFRLGCIVGDNAVIGHGTEIKHSILLNDVRVPHLSFVLDSIFGNDVNFSGGAMTPNLRFDKAPIKVKADGKLHETGLIKFGAVVGDHGNVGVGCVLNPGTLLGKNTIVHPLMKVKGVFPADSIIK